MRKKRKNPYAVLHKGVVISTHRTKRTAKFVAAKRKREYGGSWLVTGWKTSRRKRRNSGRIRRKHAKIWGKAGRYFERARKFSRKVKRERRWVRKARRARMKAWRRRR